MKRGGRKFPNRLRVHRKLMGYSQKEVVTMLGLQNESQLSRWENGERLPSLMQALHLSIIYKTLCNELYYDLSREVSKNLECRENYK